LRRGMGKGFLTALTSESYPYSTQNTSVPVIFLTFVLTCNPFYTCPASLLLILTQSLFSFHKQFH